jgi:hypothetical protein
MAGDEVQKGNVGGNQPGPSGEVSSMQIVAGGVVNPTVSQAWYRFWQDYRMARTHHAATPRGWAARPATLSSTCCSRHTRTLCWRRC